ncbi:MAG TPA: type II toxin-antitoxin system VapC family toxin [Gammaproteobacteria bacterium]|nr:type II toxin-antitoxin system VapC family toxin [Gammaproteobacteria bacterium]
MIILDTNVVSEPMRPSGNIIVRDWIDRQYPETLYLTATNLSELLVGIKILPSGKRKKELSDALNQLLINLFGSRILPFDSKAAIEYASLINHARENGAHISVADGQIAAIAALHGFTVATRDTAPFIAAGVAVINPWEE